MNEKIEVMIDKYHKAIDKFNKENEPIYKIDCFANFGEMRFYLYFRKLFEDYNKNLSATIYITMDDLEKQLCYSIYKIYFGLTNINKELYGDSNE